MVGVIGKIKMARNWFGRICVVFFLRHVDVRGSGPPIFSLFRLCISSFSKFLAQDNDFPAF